MWNVDAVTDMNKMFASASSLNGDLSSWNVGAVTDMYGIFMAAIAFNQKLCWDVTKVTNFRSIFFESPRSLDPDC